MREPILIEGKSFDWEEAKQYQDAAVDKDGNVNYFAAAFADPGVTKCPGCEEYYWRVGTLVKCHNCATEWKP